MLEIRCDDDGPDIVVTLINRHTVASCDYRWTDPSKDGALLKGLRELGLSTAEVLFSDKIRGRDDALGSRSGSNPSDRDLQQQQMQQQGGAEWLEIIATATIVFKGVSATFDVPKKAIDLWRAVAELLAAQRQKRASELRKDQPSLFDNPNMFWFKFRQVIPRPPGNWVLCGPYRSYDEAKQKRQIEKARADAEVSIVFSAASKDDAERLVV